MEQDAESTETPKDRRQRLLAASSDASSESGDLSERLGDHDSRRSSATINGDAGDATFTNTCDTEEITEIPPDRLRRSVSPWPLHDCVQAVREIFPDISYGYVAKLHRWQSSDNTTTKSEGHTNIVQYVASLQSYPTQSDEDGKREADRQAHQKDMQAKMQRGHRDPEFLKIAESMLQQAFLDISDDYIKTTLYKATNLTTAYVCLSEARDQGHLQTQRLGKRRRETSFEDFSQYDRSNPNVIHACNLIDIGRRIINEKKIRYRTEMQEVQREREAKAKGQVGECACCFADDVPLWKLTHCEGDPAHLFCFSCTCKNAETELGSGRCRPNCMDLSGCKAPFADDQLRLCLDKKVAERLIRLQQQEDLQAAGVEGLDDCPFCDFVAICPPVLVDREFRCLNQGCNKVSCRLCRTETHIPLKCEEAAEQRAQNTILGARHELEEAMSQALVRNCNRCKKPFIKAEGCNNMSCPTCGNRQCYVCRQNVNDYDHFRSGKCPLYEEEGVEARHLLEVKDAESKTKEKILAEKPEINPSELNITVSEEVAQVEAKRAQRPQRARVLNAPHAHIHVAQDNGIAGRIGPPPLPQVFGPGGVIPNNAGGDRIHQLLRHQAILQHQRHVMERAAARIAENRPQVCDILAARRRNEARREDQRLEREPRTLAPEVRNEPGQLEPLPEAQRPPPYAVGQAEQQQQQPHQQLQQQPHHYWESPQLFQQPQMPPPVQEFQPWMFQAQLGPHPYVGPLEMIPGPGNFQQDQQFQNFQIPQMPQMPQTPQFPQMPPYQQIPQTPQFLQMPPYPQIPQMPQIPQFPQMHPYPQMPPPYFQMPPYPQMPLVPPYPAMPLMDYGAPEGRAAPRPQPQQPQVDEVEREAGGHGQHAGDLPHLNQGRS